MATAESALLRYSPDVTVTCSLNTDYRTENNKRITLKRHRVVLFFGIVII